MLMKRYFFIAYIAVLSLCVVIPCGFAEEDREYTVAGLKHEIEELRGLLKEQQKTHEVQINDLKKQLQTLSQRIDSASSVQTEPVVEDSIASIREAADLEAVREPQAEETVEITSFRSGGLSLQSLNPEISITGDFIATYRVGDAVTEDFDFNFRGLGIHFESYLDPYSKIKAAVPINKEGAELGEAYFTRFGIIDNINLTLGKFRQQFGVVNRWHKHALDWVDFPLPLRMIFGEGGLNQTGISCDWTGLLGNTTQEITMQVTNGKNARLFANNENNRPSILLHYKNYRDLSSSTYLQFGLTGMIGWNNEWNLADSTSLRQDESLQVYGADITFFWEPTDRMRYRNFEWRTEAYYLHKNIIASDSSVADTLNPWGIYTSLQSKVTRTIEIGSRADYYRPAVKKYADTTGFLLEPLAVTEQDAYRWLGALYVTWYQSPFVKFRLEYNHEDGDGIGPAEDRIMLQAVVAAGPHKHERY
ncbi:MAG: hypothetical protein P9M03_09935 [Candidatus Theseobacter exili]|nr:hypothetical protein [Candidatus Theseobacter exili]